VGLAGIVSRKRDFWAGGGEDETSRTVCRLCASTEDVSHDSKVSSVLLRFAMDSTDAGRLFSRSGRSLVRDDTEPDVSTPDLRPPTDAETLGASIELVPCLFSMLTLV
jgi:hypothetical protein